MTKFTNFEFILAIRSPKLAERGVQCKIITHKIWGFLFICTPGMTWRSLARVPVHPTDRDWLRESQQSRGGWR